MSRLTDALVAAVRAAGPKPADDAPQAQKNPWNNRLSNSLALAIAQELRDRGLNGTKPSGPGEVGLSGAERRLAGGIGAKKVDVTWATEESGLILACSVKTIMWRDQQTRTFQKNLTNRRGDLLVEATTLHRRFPYSVVVGFFFLDVGAASDGTERRSSTFENVFPRFKLFTGRPDPSGRDEQFEKLFVLLVDSNTFQPSVRAWEVNDADTEVDLDAAFDEFIEVVGDRNFDLYEAVDGRITRT